MRLQRRIFSIFATGMFAASLTASGPTRAPLPIAFVSRGAPAACTLLTTDEASKALGRPSQVGKVFVNDAGCVWSNDPAVSDSSPKITVNTHTTRSFTAAMHPAITTITIERISGIGDEAFYQIYPAPQSPFIWVRKGDNVFDIRIITRTKPKPLFTPEEHKAKLAVLAKAAVSRL